MHEVASELLTRAVDAVARGDSGTIASCVDRLTALPTEAERRSCDAALFTRAKEGARSAWSRGWQPRDVLRHARRLRDETCATLLAEVIAAESQSYGPETVAAEWQEQLAALPPRWWDTDDGYLTGFGARHGLLRVEVMEMLVRAVALIVTLPRQPVLVPPPGQATATPGDQVDLRMLSRVRALLAKAESTGYPLEAEALSAKAQQLMTKHSLDQALVTSRLAPEDRSKPRGLRIGLDSPYEREKAHLLAAVAAANRCQAIWSSGLGFTTVLGFREDLAGVELLYTSLLTQAVRAVTRGGSKSWRQSFLAAYAVRIGERLSAMDTAETASRLSTELVPVLTARTEQVDSLVAQTFGRTRAMSLRVSDEDGWHSGRLEADQAHLKDFEVRPTKS